MGPAGPRIVLVRMGSYDPSKYSIVDIMKVCYMITDLQLIHDDTTIIAGHMVLVDLRGMGLSTLSQMSPTLIKYYTLNSSQKKTPNYHQLFPTRKMTSVIEAFPSRTKGIHFVNPSTGFDALFKMFHGFLSKKIQERIQVHESFEALHKVIPRSYLPEEYGGQGGALVSIIEDCKNKLVAHREFFLEDDRYRNDERKRPGRPKTAGTLFGVEGSFRSLEFD